MYKRQAYIIGYEDGTVRPGANITRAEVATIFFRLLTGETRESYWSQSSGFTDVASGAWYNNCLLYTSLYGQINSESAGLRHISGTGGQVDFLTGAAMSKGGKSFILSLIHI